VGRRGQVVRIRAWPEKVARIPDRPERAAHTLERREQVVGIPASPEAACIPDGPESVEDIAAREK
jgi:hypothetical protein